MLLPGCCQAISTTAPDHSKIVQHSVDRSSVDTDCCCYVLSKRSQRPPQMAPSLTVSGTKSSSKIDLGRAEIEPKSISGGLKSSQNRPGSAQKRPRALKSAQERPMSAPRPPQERSQRAPERSKSAPRVPRSAPRVPQERQSRPEGTFQGGLQDFWEPFCGLQLGKKRLSQRTGLATRLRSVFGSIFV